MPCMCGDLRCWSCGPAQGNSRCEICGKWDDEGGCENVKLCQAKLDEQYRREEEAECNREEDRRDEERHWQHMHADLDQGTPI